VKVFLLKRQYHRGAAESDEELVELWYNHFNNPLSLPTSTESADTDCDNHPAGTFVVMLLIWKS
jgi:hypothetical protein